MKKKIIIYKTYQKFKHPNKKNKNVKKKVQQGLEQLIGHDR